jgi:hypothetical protein
VEKVLADLDGILHLNVESLGEGVKSVVVDEIKVDYEAGDGIEVDVEVEGDDADALKRGIHKLLRGNLEKLLKVSGGAFRIGPDGNVEKLDSLPKDIERLMKGKPDGAGRRGSVTVIGPDGKKATLPWRGDAPNADAFWLLFENAVVGTGKKLPKEAGDKLKHYLTDVYSAESTTGSYPLVDDTPKGKGAILEKLDEIIKRLDMLEKEVRDLKESRK